VIRSKRPIEHTDDHEFRLASVPVTAERADVEPRPMAAVRTGLPPGATVADLVAALAAGRSAPDRRPAPDPRPAHDPRPAPDLRTAPDPIVPTQDRPPGAEAPRRPVASTCSPASTAPPAPIPPPAPPQPRPPASRRPTPPPPDPPLTLFTHQQHPSHELDRGVCPARTRPPIGDDLSLFGLSRRSRSRVGSRVFALSFAMVFGLIFVQMVFSILYP
jgi:hypothetical protein